MRGALAALGLLAAALMGLIASELTLYDDTEDPALPQVIRRPARATPTQRPTEAVIDHTGDWLATILARPLFSRDRRPAPPVAAAAGPMRAATSDGLPRLSGVLVGPFGRSAIFAGGDGGKGTIVAEGGTVGAYTVSSIAPGRVTIDGPEGTRILHPSFDPNAPRPQTAGASQGLGPQGLGPQGLGPQGIGPGFQSPNPGGPGMGGPGIGGGQLPPGLPRRGAENGMHAPFGALPGGDPDPGAGQAQQQ
jgi:hypothetical protein